MKRILIYLLIAILAFSLFTGCKKKDEAKETDVNPGQEESQPETVEEDNESKTEEASNEVEYILYLRYKDKPFLYDELFTVDINDEKFKSKPIEEFIIQELAAYEGQGEIISPIPKGVKVLSIKREDNNVIVNLSKEFKEKKMDSNDAMLAIGGIVNSIIAIPGNETAQIMVEGEALKDFNGVDVSKTFYFMEGLFPDK